LRFFLQLDGNWRVAAVFAPNFSFIGASNAVFVGEDGVPGVHRIRHRTPYFQIYKENPELLKRWPSE